MYANSNENNDFVINSISELVSCIKKSIDEILNLIWNPDQATQSQPCTPSSPLPRGSQGGGTALTPLVGYPVLKPTTSSSTASSSSSWKPGSRKNSPGVAAAGGTATGRPSPSPPSSPCSLLLDSSSDSDSG